MVFLLACLFMPKLRFLSGFLFDVQRAVFSGTGGSYCDAFASYSDVSGLHVAELVVELILLVVF